MESLPRIYFIDKLPSFSGLWWQACNIHQFLFGNKPKSIIEKYPELELLRSVPGKRTLLPIGFLIDFITILFLVGFVIKIRSKNAEIIAVNKVKVRKAWLKIERNCFTLMQEIMGIEWPRNRPIITAIASINPVCPRNPDNWTFTYFCLDEKRAIETIIHECCHFLYFKKWKEVFPDADKRTFNAPHIEWVLSELAAPIIINNSLLRQYLGEEGATFYPEHKEIEIDGKSAPEFFEEIYRRNIGKEGGFELFLREAYEEIKRHRDKFSETKNR